MVVTIKHISAASQIMRILYSHAQDRQNHTTDEDALEFGVVESTGPIVVSDCLRLKFNVHESLVGTFTDSNFNEVGVGVLSMRLRNDDGSVSCSFSSCVE